jgi:flavin-dependent dehydrogenase
MSPTSSDGFARTVIPANVLSEAELLAADGIIPALSSPAHYDVVIVGGAFSGAATALLLRRQMPTLRVLIVEKQSAFDAKVGEATTEMSAMFLTRRLALWEHLERHHLPKEGLRYWSANGKVTGHADASEAGGFLRSAVPSFQLRRDVLDEHLLKLTTDEGAELIRPGTVRAFELKDFDNTVTIARKDAAGTETTQMVRCTWLVDASGHNCFLGRKLGLIDWNDAHPIASIWARWQNIRHLDDLAARSGGRLGTDNVGSRRLATNHYVGHGFWIWVIPLGNGETSVGVVFDKRIHSLHESPERERTYVSFLKQHPALAELLDGATLRKDDLRARARVAYVTRQYMGPGWALVGDAAAFIDPYYSPGLDHCAFSAEATTRIILAYARGDTSPEQLPDVIRRHNELFLRSYHRFFDCIYRDKYFLFGEHDLITASFLLDTALYYIFVVTPAYRFVKAFVPVPVLGPRQAYTSYVLLKCAKHRFNRIADLRRRTGEAGARNHGHRIKAYFDLGLSPVRMFARGLKLWVRAELDALRLRLIGRQARPTSEPCQPSTGGDEPFAPPAAEVSRGETSTA